MTRLLTLTAAATLIAVALRMRSFEGCELVGHDPYWATSTLRRCHRCPITWRRENEPIGATTTNQEYGW